MDDPTFLFDGWMPIARIAFIAAGGYLTLLGLLKASGQRPLAQMTPFDFVIAVTIGSAFGRTLTAREVSLAEVAAMFAALIALQWLVAGLRHRSTAFGRLVTPDPAVVFHDGEVVSRAMRRHRLTESDLLVAVREEGMGSLEEAHTIVFEPDGKFAVISAEQLGDGTALPVG